MAAPVAPVAPPPAKNKSARGGGNGVTKLTVNLSPRTVAALDEAADINGESKTNAVNRAIQAYAFLTRTMNNGWELVLRDPEERREQLVQFL